MSGMTDAEVLAVMGWAANAPHCTNSAEIVLATVAVAALIAERDALRKDAERYRWLRDLPEGSPHEQIGNFCGDEWDAEIDRAMKAEEAEQANERT